MQREILFRGKRVDNGEWIYGYYAYDIEWAKGYILSQKQTGAFYQLGSTQVIPESVGQFTGLLDKNGIKIFEGDILSIDWGIDTGLARIIYNKHKYRFDYVSKGCKEGYSILELNQLLSSGKKRNLEVIGNLIDNPQLLTPCP